ncbi:MAG: DUF2846 domain-containing protein [SAR324 cluster bacterium]
MFPLPRRAPSAWVTLALMALLALLAGCGGEALAPIDEDRAAKALQPAPGRALIYVYRPSQAGIDIHLALLVGGKQAGFLDDRTYFVLDTPPGKVTITIDEVNRNSIEETVQAGEIRYVRVSLGPWHLTFRGFPVAVPKDEAVTDLARCRLIRIVTL